MGNLLTAVHDVISSRLTVDEEVRLLLLGLDAAGKTTTLYKLKCPRDEVITTMPTIGFNVETMNLHGKIITAWDVGGRDKTRALWRHYCNEMKGMIFVLDSNDRERFDQARDELNHILNESELGGVPLLVLCNKQDLPNAMSPIEIRKELGIDEHMSRQSQIAVFGCVATTGSGLLEGMAWLVQTISTRKDPPPTTSNKDHQSAREDHQSAREETTDSDFSKRSLLRGSYLDFEPVRDNITLQHFAPIKNGSECPFAKSSKLWGGAPITASRDIEGQSVANVQALREFTRRVRTGDKLDGFCIELDDPTLTKETGNPQHLGDCVRRMLTHLALNDPSGENSMKVSYIGKRGWRFRFNQCDFFVTTFAPCYPATSSRFAFGCGRAFVLLQPELSFARHDLPLDTAHTNWEEPKNIRDETRIAFRKAGKGYHIPTTTKYPMAEHIVKPLYDDGQNVVHWWHASQTERTRYSR
jgi:small GTP-binding protein